MLGKKFLNVLVLDGHFSKRILEIARKAPDHIGVRGALETGLSRSVL